jgi:hypothetical protein
MIRKGLIFLFISSGVSACGVPDNALVVHGLAGVEFDDTANTCEYSGDLGATRLISSRLDTAASFTLDVSLLVQNNLANTANDISSGGTELKIDHLNSLTPLRYSLQWECDNTAFSGGGGGLIVPHFDAEKPFCYDTRNAQSSGAFDEFDVVPVSGFPVLPLESAAWNAQLIPPEFGQHLQDAFEIAKLADDCCGQTDSCSGITDPSSPVPSCDELVRLFLKLDPEQEKGLIVASEDPEQASPVLQRFAPFSVFDNSYNLGTTVDGRFYSVRQRGVFEAAMPDGETLQSAQVVTTVQLGRYLARDPSGNACSPGVTVCRVPYFDPCSNQ